VGALLAFLFRPDLGLPPVVVRALRNSTLTFTAVSLALGAFATGIDNAAHLGGLATGLVMGLVLARPLVPGQGRRDAFLRFAAVLILGGAALGLAVRPVLHPAPRIVAESRFLLDVDWLAGREAEVAADFRALGNLVQAGRITPKEFARRVTLEIMPRWREAEQRLQGSAVPPDSELAPLQAALGDYIAARSRQFELLSQPLDPRDPAALRRIEAQAAVVETRRQALHGLQAR
jgi:rhomboid protease GluP